MTRRIRIRAVERQEIDIDKLAEALLRLARERMAEADANLAGPKSAERDHE